MTQECTASMSCPKCEQVSNFDAMCRTPINGWLPRGQFQCPQCGHAFRRCEVTAGTMLTRGKSSLYIPGDLALVPTEARL